MRRGGSADSSLAQLLVEDGANGGEQIELQSLLRREPSRRHDFPVIDSDLRSAIELESEGIGKGSRFTVRLPAAARCGPAPEEAADRSQGSRGELSHVLVVDDGKSTADILAMFFELEGLEVSVAYDGMEALESAKARMPQLILMDLGMPRMDGFEAARRIRELPGGGNVTMVALSGWGQEKDKLRSREAGFDDHLVKPVSPGDLRVLMDRLRAAAS